MTYSANTAWYEYGLHVDVMIPGFPTHEAASQFARDCGSLVMVLDDEKPSMLLEDPNGNVLKIKPSQVIFRVDSKAKERPPALDSRDPVQLQQILDTMDDPNSPYIIQEEDLEVISLTFEQVAKAVAIPIRFGSLAYGASKQSFD